MMFWICREVFLLLLLTAVPALLLASCTPTKPNELDKLGTVRMTIKEQPFRLWVADSFDEQQRGLMFVTTEQMAPLSDGTKRGMIFVFDHEQELSFWMKNTIIPLDIAYVDTAGRVVNTYTMAPLDDRIGRYPSRGASRYAIEVNADVLGELGVKAGDVLEIPTDALKRIP